MVSIGLQCRLMATSYFTIYKISLYGHLIRMAWRFKNAACKMMVILCYIFSMVVQFGHQIQTASLAHFCGYKMMETW